MSAAFDPPERPNLGPVAGGKALVAFYRQLATLYEAGIEIRTALRTIEPGLSDPALRAGVLAVQSTLQRGGTLGEGMRRYPNVFRPLHVTLIEAAEASGHVAEALASIADFEEARLAARRRLLLGFAYPFLLLNLAILVPAIPEIFIHGPVAFLETAGIGFGALYGAIALGGAGLAAARRLPLLGRAVGGLVWHAPVAAGIVRRQAASRFLRVLGAVHASGMSMTAGVRMAARACGSPVMEAKVLPAAEAVDRGEHLTESLGATGAFAPATIALVASGEAAGKLDDMLRRASDLLDGEAKARVQFLSIVLPLVAYLGVGAFVAWKVISFWAGFYGDLAP